MDYFSNHEAEMTLIGSILTQNNIMAEASIILKPEDFFSKANETIFSEMLEMYKANIGIDRITVASHMSPEKLKSIGGTAYLFNAEDSPATILNYRQHINEIKKKSQVRKIARAMNEGSNRIQSEDPEEVIQYLQTEIMDSQKNGHALINSTKEIASDILDGQPETKIMTGYKALDRTMKGLKKGRVLTIAGRPGTGKTAFALRILDQLPTTERAFYFSLEMSKREITERLMAAQSYTKLDKIINKMYTPEEEEKLRHSKVMTESNILIDDTPGLTIHRIKARARIEKIKHGLSVIFVDHIGLLNPSMASMKSYERMTEISKGLKEMAKELDVTVIALSQLNRSPDGRTNGEPLLSDLRDSGSVEQDSDQVILLYNPDYQEKSGQEIIKAAGPETLIAKIAKNRCGGVGKIKFDYFKDTQAIEEQRR